MKKYGAMIIRSLMSLVLTYAVYTETGIWTALFTLLVLVNFELTAFLLKKLLRRTK